MLKRKGRKLVSDIKDLPCGHCGKIVLATADLAEMQQMGGIALSGNHPALIRVLRRLGGDDFAECPHCHALHALVLEADLSGGPALWHLKGLRKISDPPKPRYWEGQPN